MVGSGSLSCLLIVVTGTHTEGVSHCWVKSSVNEHLLLLQERCGGGGLFPLSHPPLPFLPDQPLPRSLPEPGN